MEFYQTRKDSNLIPRVICKKCGWWNDARKRANNNIPRCRHCGALLSEDNAVLHTTFTKKQFEHLLNKAIEQTNEIERRNKND